MAMEIAHNRFDAMEDEEDLSFGTDKRRLPPYTGEQLKTIYTRMSSWFGKMSSDATARVPALLNLENYTDREVQQDILWEGYEGENVFIQEFISNDFKNIRYRDFLLREFNVYEFSEMLKNNPSVYVFDKLVRWTSYHSPEVLLDSTAEGTPGQLINSTEQKEEKYMATCTMAGFRMNQDWMNSARQRKFFWMNVKTLNKALNAFLACNFYDSITDGGLMEYQDLNPFSRALSQAEFHRQLTLKCDRFAACNKGGIAFKGLETWMFEKISDLGGEMNFLLADQQALRTLSLEGAPSKVHALGGPEAKKVDDDMFYQRPEQSDGKLFPISPAHKINIYTCRQFIRKNRKVYNPLAFDTTAGQMFPALGNNYASHLSEYRSWMRNLDIVNGNTHSFDRKTQMDFVDASGLFNDDHKLSVLGVELLNVILNDPKSRKPINAPPSKDKGKGSNAEDALQRQHRDWLNALQIFEAAKLAGKIIPCIQKLLKSSSAARRDWNALPRYENKKKHFPASSQEMHVQFGTEPIEKLIEKTAFDSYNASQTDVKDRITPHTDLVGKDISHLTVLNEIVRTLGRADAYENVDSSRLHFLRKVVALYAIVSSIDEKGTPDILTDNDYNVKKAKIGAVDAKNIIGHVDLIQTVFLDNSDAWVGSDIINSMKQTYGQDKPQLGFTQASLLKRKAFESVTGMEDYDYSPTEALGWSSDVVRSGLNDIMISYEMFQFFDTHDILIPLNWVILRPYVQVHMSMLVGGMKGDDTAIMIYKNATTGITRERAIQQVKYDVKMTAGTICTGRKRLITEPFALCTGIKSGVGTRFFDWHDPDLRRNLKNSDFKDRDMFCILAPWNSRVSEGIAVDLLGQFNSQSCAVPLGAGSHIETQPIYKTLLGLNHTAESNQFGLNFIMNHRPVNSTVCVRGTYRAVDEKGVMELKVGVDWFSPADAEYAFAILGGAGAYSGRGIERVVPGKGR